MLAVCLRAAYHSSVYNLKTACVCRCMFPWHAVLLDGPVYDAYGVLCKRPLALHHPLGERQCLFSGALPGASIARNLTVHLMLFVGDDVHNQRHFGRSLWDCSVCSFDIVTLP